MEKIQASQLPVENASCKAKWTPNRNRRDKNFTMWNAYSYIWIFFFCCHLLTNALKFCVSLKYVKRIPSHLILNIASTASEMLLFASKCFLWYSWIFIDKTFSNSFGAYINSASITLRNTCYFRLIFEWCEFFICRNNSTFRFLVYLFISLYICNFEWCKDGIPPQGDK